MSENQDPSTSPSFWDSIDWSKISHNKIPKEEFQKIKLKNKKAYSTLLGSTNELSFFMFKSLSWADYKEIRSRGLDKLQTQEYIINSCILWPKQDPVSIASMEAGMLLTLCYQVMATSYFMTDPNRALECILEC